MFLIFSHRRSEIESFLTFVFDVKLNADYNNVTLDFDVIVSTFVFDVKFWTSDFDVKRR